MSTFYLLPPRPVLGQQFAQFLESQFPGLAWTATERAGLAESLGDTAAKHPGVVVVFREDLPEGTKVLDALVDDFGAEAGDEIVEVAPHAVQRWWVAG